MVQAQPFVQILLAIAAADAAPPVDGRVDRPVPTDSYRRFASPGPASAIGQDPNGFLWLATTAGLFRFDGVEFKHVAATSGVTPKTLAFDRDGVLWLGATAASAAASSGGVFIERDGHLLRMDRLSLATGPDVRSLVFDSDGTLWVHSSLGLFAWHDDNVYKLDSTSPGGQGLDGTTIAAIHNVAGKLWVATNAGIFSFDGKFRKMAPDSDVADFTVDEKQRLWMTTSNLGDRIRIRDGASVIVPGHIVTRAFNVPGRPGNIRAAAGGLTIGASNGLFWTDGARIERRVLSGLTRTPSIDVLFFDAAANLWFTSEQGDLLQIKASPVLRYETSGRTETVFSVVVDGDDTVWMTASSELRALHPDGRQENFPVPAELHAFDLRSIALGPDGQLWITVTGRLLSFDRSSHRWSEHPGGPPVNRLRGLVLDRANTLWAGLADGGLARLQTGPFRVEPVADSRDACPAAVTDFSLASDGTMWFTTHGAGLCWFDGRSVHRWSGAGGLGNENLMALTWDRAGLLWLGSETSGLSVLRNGKRFPIPAASGLPTKTVYEIFEDDAGLLWLGSPEGLYRVPRSDLLEFLDGQRSHVRSLLLGLDDGLSSTVFMGAFTPNSARAHNGSLYFTNGRGLVHVPDPARAGTAALPEPILDRVVVNGRDVSTHGPIRAAVGNGQLEVHFAAADLEHARRLRFAYMLEDFDTGWHELGEAREARNEGVPAGSYTLKIAVYVNDRDDRKILSVPITLTPPFYASETFRIIAVFTLLLVLAGAALSIHRLRLWRTRQRFSAVTEERTRIARDMHDTLEQSLLGMKIQLEVMEESAGDAAAVKAQISRIQELLLQSLRDAKSSIWALRSGLSADGDLVQILSVLAGSILRGTDITFRIGSTGTPYPLQAVAQQHVVRVVQEALTNAIKHGHARTIEVRVDFSSDNITFRLTDDGQGFDVERAAGASLGHFGLAGMRERAIQIGATLTVDSRKGHGTTVVLTIPAKHRRKEDPPRVD